MEKLCSKCRKLLPADSFYRDDRIKNGLSSQCKKCVKTYYKEHESERKAWRKLHRERLRKEHESILSAFNSHSIKICKGCGLKKKVSEFYVSRGEPSGLQSRCKVCMRVWVKSDKGKAAIKKYNATPQGLRLHAQGQRNYAASRKGKNTLERFAEKNPEKRRAKMLLGNEVAHGRIVKPKHCTRCGIIPPPMYDGRTSIQGHHTDYGKPYDIEWLCIKCHKVADRERKEQDFELEIALCS